MNKSNPCHGCIENKGNDCCVDVFIILNETETHLFEKHKGFLNVGQLGGIFYTINGCPYLDSEKYCIIHDKKPLYCKFYPIFITGDIYTDDECPMHTMKAYKLDEKRKIQIKALQKQFPIYKYEWLFSDIQEKYQESDLIGC
ncbi:MAG: YkgJ family cysteine cluster protein [Candidatus Hodarchaeota archaeon]